MQFCSLHLHNFRNFEELHLDFGTGVTVFSGNNGIGKTNLLEAIHLISQGFSFKTTKLSECIAWDAQQCGIRAQIKVQEAQATHNRTLQLQTNGTKRCKMDEVVQNNMSALFGEYPVIVMQPSDMDLIKGGPRLRRRFLDILISQQNAVYLNVLKQYNRVIAQRNALLKDQVKNQSQTSHDSTLKKSLDELLCEYGGQIISIRMQSLHQLQQYAQEHLLQISGGKESLQIVYSTTPKMNVQQGQSLSATEASQILKSQLQSVQKQEQFRQVSLVGPHRDDMELMVHQHSLREYGSQGQCRSASLALHLAAAQTLSSQGIAPLLLLDDIFAELDNSRKLAIEQLAQNSPQVFVTAPHTDGLPFREYAHYPLDKK